MGKMAINESLSLATCWDDGLLDKLCGQGIQGSVHELFGSLHTSIVGSGRPSFRLPKVSTEQARTHIDKCHSVGIGFNYLLNASCLGNREFEGEGRKRIISLLEWLDDCQVDTVTVSIPYLVELVKRRFPRMEVNISTIAHVNSVSRARAWEGIGADRITVDFMMNRDFDFLGSLCGAVKCGVEVIANDLCLYGCPFRYYHYNVMAHTSQQVDGEDSPGRLPASSYPALKCSLIRMTDFSEIIKSRWIRPEDIGSYRDLGVDLFKIVERTRPMSFLVSCARAYADQAYDGNLLEIVPLLTSGVEGQSSPKSLPIYLDNKKLDGFLDHFRSKRCQTECHACGYCQEVATRAIEVRDQRELDRLIGLQARKLDSVTEGDAIGWDTG